METDVRDIIRKYNINLTKSLGQNFLIDGSVIKRIVDAAGVGPEDLVVEVGAGVGNMTRELASRAGYVIGVEIDRRLMPALSENLAVFTNVEIVNQDILKIDIRKKVLEKKDNGPDGRTFSSVKVVANLPYYITTPIIMKFLEELPEADILVFMVQKEVASRMTAKPGTKDYGALTVAVQYYSNPEKLFVVPPHCFIPQPEVDSTVVRLVAHKIPPVELEDRDTFFKMVKAAFGQRRKTLVNAICNSGYFTQSKEEIKEILKNVGIDENSRGETLSIVQFANLSNSFFRLNC